MPNNEPNWTTVSGKSKSKAAPSSTKPSGIPVIPKAEVKTIKLSDSAFSSMKDRLPGDNDENQPVESKIPKATSSTDKNSTVKVNKPSKPTTSSLSLKQALQNINAEKLKKLYESSKENSSLWVEKVCYWFIEQFKDVTSGLHDPTFSKEANQDYPLNSLPSSVKEYLNEIFDVTSQLKAITLCRTGILQPNTDMNSIVGYQVLLQYFLRNLDHRPKGSFLDEVNELSNSLKRYPSDKVLRLLWAYSQVQYDHPGLALDIWFRLMFPFIENRTYNQLIVETLTQLTARHAKNKKFLQSDEIFPVRSYVEFIDFVDQPNPALTREMRLSMTNSATILSDLFVNNTKNISSHTNEYFQALFPALHAEKQRSTKTQSNIDRMIVACFKEKTLFKLWLLQHEKYPQSSLNLLSILKANEATIPGLSSSKEFATIVQQLRAVSTKMINEDKNDSSPHIEFLRVYAKNDTKIVSKRSNNSKAKGISTWKLLILIIVLFSIYYHWLWLTVAAEYLLEDYLKHPTAIVIQEQLTNACQQTKKFSLLSLKYGEEFLRTSLNNIEPYAVRFGQYLQKQWTFLLKYIEGPIYDKSLEVAEQIRRLSLIIFNETVQHMNKFFDWASYHTADLTQLTGIYLKQVYEIIHYKWAHFNSTELREKFDQIRMRVIKSV